MPLDDVQIRLAAFEGPLDLLLHLIRKNEVEITDIPISRIAEQYMATLAAAGVDHIDIELAGEFLVMAATLMEIKSRMLMPRAEGATDPAADATAPIPGETEDPRADLVRQLLAYKRFRDAAATLDRRYAEWEKRFPGGGAVVSDSPEADDAEVDLDLDDLDITDLTRAFAGIMETVDFSRVGEHLVTDDETPIELHAADILDRLQREREGAPAGIEFRELFRGRTRSEMIGLFLAMLELIRQRKIEARQDRINDAIHVQRSAPEPAVQPPAP
ncbi:MAG: segregation and condensation protein A [Phycisphaerales bacterium]